MLCKSVYSALHASADRLLQTRDCCQHSTAQHSTAQHSTAQHSSAQLSTFVVCAVCQLIVLCPLQWTVREQTETMQFVVDGSHSALQHSMAHKAHHGTL